jgi:hypothetical protein
MLELVGKNAVRLGLHTNVRRLHPVVSVALIKPFWPRPNSNASCLRQKARQILSSPSFAIRGGAAHDCDPVAGLLISAGWPHNAHWQQGVNMNGGIPNGYKHLGVTSAGEAESEQDFLQRMHQMGTIADVHNLSSAPIPPLALKAMALGPGFVPTQPTDRYTHPQAVRHQVLDLARRLGYRRRFPPWAITHRPHPS